MHVLKKLWLSCFIVSLSILPIEAKKSGISGFIKLLFPLPSLLYSAGYNKGSDENSLFYTIDGTIKYDYSNKFRDQGSFFDVIYPYDTKLKSFKDVAGLDAAKDSIQDIIDYLENPTVFRNMGAVMPMGILLNGGPGNGKTLFARATAGEVNCTFISVKGSDFASKWAAVGKEKVEELFRIARKNAPCIIFIDEIDAIASRRSNNSDSLSRDDNKTLITLLTEMDGFYENEQLIIVIGATNRIDQLDPAILRPGRFDRIIEIGKPLFNDRIQLLEIALAKSPVSTDINFNRLAQITDGFSGAELANMVNEALILAVKDNSSCVCMRHLELAYKNKKKN